MLTRGAPHTDLLLLTATLEAAANTGSNLGLLGSMELVLSSDDFKLFILFQKKYAATLLLTDVLNQIRSSGMLHTPHEGVGPCKLPQTHSNLILRVRPPSPHVP